MIRFREATTLALTKLRIRKVRLVVTIVISGLLFGMLAALSMISQGVFSSVANFGEEGFADRYIVRAIGMGYAGGDDPVIERAKAIHKETVAQKQAEAKRLGIEYDATGDRGPVEEIKNGFGGGSYTNLDYGHPAVIQARLEHRQANPIGTFEQLKATAEPFGGMAFYQNFTLPDLRGAQLQVLRDGKEAFDKRFDQSQYTPTGTDSFISGWALLDGELLKPFILPGQNLETGADGSVPVIVPLSAAEQLVKMEPLLQEATPKQRLERTQELRKAVTNVTFEVCYRNITSAELVQRAVATQQEIAANKDKKDYRQPDLVYTLPAQACGAVTTGRDVRSAEQKTLDAKQLAFDQKFGAEPAAQSTLRFRVVGIVPDIDMNPTSIVNVLGSLVSSSLGGGWYSPIDQATKQPLIAELFTREDRRNDPTFMAEFATAAEAKTFIKSEDCEPDFSNYVPGQTDPAQSCIDAGHYFSIHPYGSNSLAIESARRGFNKFLTIVGLVIIGIACIILMGTVGKMVADSRRETAVFRAIGAKKMDIAQIYILYTVFISLLIALFAIIMGAVLALWANARWSEGTTQQALLIFNVQDMDKVFRFYGLYIPHILLLIGATVAAGLLSAMIPILRSLRRNPMRDMRDDT